MIRTCKHCGKPLPPGKRLGSRFCDSTCRARASEQALRSAQESPRAGLRGGPLPPLSLSDVQQLFATWRSREYGWVRAHILLQAAEAGEFHADDTAEWELAQPNVIGAAVNALATARLLEKRNRNGEREHRRGSSAAAHGRASYVWRATERGKQVARQLWHQREANIGFFKSAGVGAGVPLPQGAEGPTEVPSRASVDPGGRLFTLPSRSAQRDPEAA